MNRAEIHFPIDSDVISDCCWKFSNSQQDLFECIHVAFFFVAHNPCTNEPKRSKRKDFWYFLAYNSSVHANIGLNWVCSWIDISACMIRVHPTIFIPKVHRVFVSHARLHVVLSQPFFATKSVHSRLFHHPHILDADAAAAVVMWIHQSINWNLSCDCTKRITMRARGNSIFQFLSLFLC